MKKAPRKAARGIAHDEPLPEYDFSRAKRGTHAHLANVHAVTIDPDVWTVFPSAKAINEALRAAARIVKHAQSRRRGAA
jgi:hypothetical protein